MFRRKICNLSYSHEIICVVYISCSFSMVNYLSRVLWIINSNNVKYFDSMPRSMLSALQWRHNGHDSVSNHQPHDCLLNRLFRRRSKKISKLRVTGFCAGNSPETGEFPAQMASNAECVSIWWRHHGLSLRRYSYVLKIATSQVYHGVMAWIFKPGIRYEWQHNRRPIRSHVRKSLLTNMGFNMNVLII